MMRRLLLAVALLGRATIAHAQNISNPGPSGLLRQIQVYSPLGQSFTAVSGSLLSIGFAFDPINSSFGNVPVTVNLLSGSGTGGALVASRTINPLSNNGSFDASTLSFADFTGTSLSVGATYTAVLATTNPYWGVFRTDDTYAGGTSFFNDTESPDADLVFQVNGANAVPEPASGALLVVGAGALLAAFRRRRASVMR
jgi:hypothetical protein